jgi:hypothetical protein
LEIVAKIIDPEGFENIELPSDSFTKITIVNT